MYVAIIMYVSCKTLTSPKTVRFLLTLLLLSECQAKIKFEISLLRQSPFVHQQKGELFRSPIKPKLFFFFFFLRGSRNIELMADFEALSCIWD